MGNDEAEFDGGSETAEEDVERFGPRFCDDPLAPAFDCCTMDKICDGWKS